MVVFIRFCHFSNTATVNGGDDGRNGCVGKMTEPDKDHHFPVVHFLLPYKPSLNILCAPTLSDIQIVRYAKGVVCLSVDKPFYLCMPMTLPWYWINRGAQAEAEDRLYCRHALLDKYAYMRAQIDESVLTPSAFVCTFVKITKFAHKQFYFCVLY